MKTAYVWEENNDKREIKLSTLTIDDLKEMAYPVTIDQSELNSQLTFTCSTVSEELQTLIDKLSDPLSICLLKGLCLINVDITPQILELMQKLLNARFSQPLSSLVFSLQHEYYNTVAFRIEFSTRKISQSSTNQNPCEVGNGNGNGNEYQNENIYSASQEVYGSPNVSEFSLDDSITVVDCLMTGVREISNTNALTVNDRWLPEYYRRIGYEVRMNTNLNDLQLKIGMEAPQRLEILFTAAYPLTSFSLRNVTDRIPDKLKFCDICHQAVIPLLQDPNSQLQHLCFNNYELDDDDFITILDLLPTSRLKTFDVFGNHIRSRGLQEFTRRLPNIKSLTEVCLEYNPWEKSYSRQEHLEALLQGVMHNTSIEHLQTCFYYPLIDYYCKLNFIRRNIVSASFTIMAFYFGARTLELQL